MRNLLLSLVVLAACGVEQEPQPDATDRTITITQWSCQSFSDCAGSAQLTSRTVVAGSQADAEVQLADECESQSCPGALACHAVCSPSIVTR